VAIFFGFYHGKLLLLYLNDPAFIVTEANRPIIMFPPFPFLVASCFLRFIINRIRADRREKEQKAEALASELKFLRSQISPHFLFNVMTNLVSLARLKSDLLEPTLIRFSEMLRYTLYETNEEKFPVSKEIEYLKNYVDLQMLRFGEDVDLKMNIRTDDPDCIIEPMLLIPFVENAFKHGIGIVAGPFIHIDLKVEQSLLYFKVTNNYTQHNTSRDQNSGIGLANVRNRLQLLYGKRHELTIKDNSDLYIVELKLHLVC
jgi:LytS/YehU family sensor histidine kinase